MLQARTGSSRLPAKVLLPVGGLPLAVLAAKRAASTGREVIVATSTCEDDDGLASVLAQHGLAVHRGHLDNVLERVSGAAAGLPDDALIVRLTADNVFPDGRLIDEVIADFMSRGVEYLDCNGEPSGLPYGVSCEVTRLGHLREALREATEASDLEHVTPYVIRKFGATYFEKYASLRKGHFRCTVDSYDDYMSVQRVFAGVPDPVNEPVLDLVRRLAGGRYQPVVDRPVPKLVIGTAQLGMPYGIANSHGQPGTPEAERIVKTAIGNGVAWADTARGYGASEAVLGEILANGWSGRVRIATKLSPLADCVADTTSKAVQALVDASVYESCTRLRVQQLDAVLLHRASHLDAWDGAAWRRLLELRRQGTIGTLGVSVQDARELETALRIPDVGIVQMPFNVLDWRWKESEQLILEARAARPLIVHARSSLLQGLLCSRSRDVWRRAHVDAPEPIWDWLDAMRQEHRCVDVSDLCTRYVRSHSWVDGVVVGMETLDQVVANVRHFSGPALAESEMQAIERTRPHVRAETLDPARWLT